MAEKVWLTFMNSGGLTEPQIRAELEVFGSVLECDGAIGGEGWVMVAMADKQEADKAVKCLKVGLKPFDCKLLHHLHFDQDFLFIIWKIDLSELNLSALDNVNFVRSRSKWAARSETP